MLHIQTSIENIQKKVNEFIYYDLKQLVDSSHPKIEYLDEEHWKAFLNEEKIKTTDELRMLLEQYNQNLAGPYKDGIYYYKNKDFLWNSSFYEWLNEEEKTKYIKFDASILDYNKYIILKECYDNDLPYFSKIIRCMVLKKYLSESFEEMDYLYCEKNGNKKMPDTEKKASKKKDNHKKTLESNFNNKQIEILTDCVNNLHIFKTKISQRTMKQIFNCSLKNPIQIKNTNLLVLFFAYLEDDDFITRKWQSICETEKIFLTVTGAPVKKSLLSSYKNTNSKQYTAEDIAIKEYIKKLKEKTENKD